MVELEGRAWGTEVEPDGATGVSPKLVSRPGAADRL
jgi:hypothetical protein